MRSRLRRHPVPQFQARVSIPKTTRLWVTRILAATLWAILPFLPQWAQAAETEWDSLNEKIVFHIGNNSYGEALVVANDALRAAELTYGNNHPKVATSLNILGKLHMAQHRLSQAEPLFNRSLEIFEQSYGPKHPEVARTLNNLASLYFRQGQYSRAEPRFKRSLAIGEEVFEPGDPRISTALNNLALVYRSLGQFNEAESLYRRSLAISEKTFGQNHRDVEISLSNLADLYQSQGQFERAEQLYMRSLSIMEGNGGQNTRDAATSINNLADLYVSQGRYVEAEKLYMRSLTILEKIDAADNTDIATSLNNLAGLYYKQEQFARAEPLYERSLEIRKSTLDHNHPDIAASLNNLANVYKAQGKYTQAESFYEEALKHNQDVLGADHHAIAATLANLGVLHRTQGRLVQAESLLNRALKIGEKDLGPDHPDIAEILNQLGLLSVAQGRYSRAESFFLRSIAIREKALGVEHPDVSSALSNLGGLYSTLSRLNDSLDAYRRSARVLAHRLETANETLPSQAAPQQIRSSDIFVSYALLVRKLLSKSDDRNRSSLIAESFAAAQYARLGDIGAALAQMASRASANNASLSKKIREQQDALATWRQLEKRWVAILGRPAAERQVSEELYLRQKLAETDALVTRLNGELQHDFPEYRELVTPESLSVVDAQKLLKPDEAMLTFLVADQETLLWVVSAGRSELIRISAGKSVLTKQVATLRRTMNLALRVQPDFSFSTSHLLYKTLFAPAIPLLEGKKHIIVVADGPLQSLPFGLLLSAPVSGEGEAKPPWLMREYAFSNLPAVTSLRALRRFSKAGDATEPFMGFGDPLLEGTPEESRGVSAATLFAHGAVADGRELRRLSRLPETADELRSIAKTLDAQDSSLFLGSAATERQVKSMDLSRYRVLAFATHGLMSGEFLGLTEPALVMTPPDEATATDDGLLTASEIAGLKLNADWVILSACNTAATDGTPGANGFSGLSKAFFYAGSQSLLVAHWTVGSKATVALTTRMFSEAKLGFPKAEALRRAMMAVADSPQTAHPAYWAPFVLVGEAWK